MNTKKFIISRLVPQRFEKMLRSFRDQFIRSYKIEKLPKEIYSKELKFYKVSFCITCMNRLFHLKNTLEKNILDNRTYKNLEFIVINYNSKDHLDKWMKQHMLKYIESGIVKYYKTDDPSSFHASKAKNLSHLLAEGDIVCNLDGDNFTGKDFAFYINYMFNKYEEDLFLHFTKKPFWGTEGRMALSKENFLKLGGYDEDLLPIGHEDHDLMNRAKASGFKYLKIEIENFLRYLSNTEKEKAENCVDDSTSFYVLEKGNQEKSNENINNGKLIANPSGTEKFTLFKNFSTDPIPYP
ncbi:N-terminal domain of galactosyltransferase [Marivirga sericea]|uniref:N-terminal domain of galactosyltransferase n=1 Tax=Marivirga sericea TaxID=1028 RepID=A0A1X7KKM8_9BACT|nr:glycosyltransferase family A protein [Marivirga sericea]SMG41835.1 N-terminal domain of galactosyltransferase [Marivirga sericea]